MASNDARKKWEHNVHQFAHIYEIKIIINYYLILPFRTMAKMCPSSLAATSSFGRRRLRETQYQIIL